MTYRYPKDRSLRLLGTTVAALAALVALLKILVDFLKLLHRCQQSVGQHVHRGVLPNMHTSMYVHVPGLYDMHTSVSPLTAHMRCSPIDREIKVWRLRVIDSLLQLAAGFHHHGVLASRVCSSRAGVLQTIAPVVGRPLPWLRTGGHPLARGRLEALHMAFT